MVGPKSAIRIVSNWLTAYSGVVRKNVTKKRIILDTSHFRSNHCRLSAKKCVKKVGKKLSSCHNLKFFNPYSLQPDGVNLLFELN